MYVDYTKFTVAQLKAELKERGLDITGKKAELLERVLKHVEENNADEEAELEEEAEEETEEVEAEENQEEEKAEEETTTEENEAEETETKTEEAAVDLTEDNEDDDPAEEEKTEEQTNQEENATEANDDEAAEEKEEAVENDEKMDVEEEQQENVLESGEFIMVDEANDEEDEIDEDTLLGLDNDNDDKGQKDGVEIEIQPDDDILAGEEMEVKAEADKKKADKKKADDAKNNDKEIKKEKDDEKKGEEKKEEEEDEIKELPEEDIVALEKEADVRKAAEKRKESKRFMFHSYKSTVLAQLDASRFKKTVVVSPFQPKYLVESEAVKECVLKARTVDMHARRDGDKGWLELKYKMNKDAAEAKDKLTGAVDGTKAEFLDMKHWRNTVSYFEKKLTRDQEFMDKYRECMMLAIMELPEDKVDTVTNDDIEDELMPVFSGAYSVTVPDTANDVGKDLRFILVEYGSRDKVKKAQEETDKKDIEVAGIKLSFKNYQAQWLEAKLHINQKPARLEKPGKKEPKSEEERYTLGKRIRSIYLSMQKLKKGEADARLEILSTERNRLREVLRDDDRLRSEKKLPRLPWVPEKEKKEEEKKPDRSGSKDKSRIEFKKSDQKDRKRSAEKSRDGDRQSSGSKRARQDSPQNRRSRDDNKRDQRNRSADRNRGQARQSNNRPQQQQQQNNRTQANRGKPGQRSLMGMPPGGDRQNYNNQRGLLNTPPNMNNNRGIMGNQPVIGMNQGNMMGNNQQGMYGRQGMMSGNQGMIPSSQPGIIPGNQAMMASGQALLQNPGVATSETGSTPSNPVQLLLGLSKVLSNQIKVMQTNEPEPAQQASYNDGSYRSQQSSNRGGDTRQQQFQSNDRRSSSYQGMDSSSYQRGAYQGQGSNQTNRGGQNYGGGYY